MTTTNDTDNAMNQAKAQLESIQAMVARLEHSQECDGDLDAGYEMRPHQCDLSDGDFLEFLGEPPMSLRKPTTEERGDYHDEDEARQRIDEDPLSVQVRSGWTDPGQKFAADEYEILLCTGGPAVRIIGELDQYTQPDRARLQYQDWGTPWTELLEPRDMQALIAYASNFYFGE